VPNTKVVPNIEIHLHENCHNLLSLLTNWKILWKKKRTSPSWTEIAALAQPTAQSRPAPISLPLCAPAMWGWVPIWATCRSHPLCTGPTSQGTLPQIPLCCMPPALVAGNLAAVLTGCPRRCARPSVAYARHHGRLVPSRTEPSPRPGCALLRWCTHYRCRTAASS
jgi:hypothetical protein